MEQRDDHRPAGHRPRATPPAINVPAIVLAVIAVLVGLHVYRTQVIGQAADLEMLLDYSFIAGCYQGPVDICALRLPGAGLWSPVSHAFLHGDWTHLGANILWLLAFGTPVARRIGAARFLLFGGLGAVAGAALFYAVNPTLLAPMIGASGIVSALMGAASRFALGMIGRDGRRDVAFAPRLSIGQSLSDRTVLFFVAIFFLTNLLIGSGIGSAVGADIPVAWEAHLGGFAFGFLCFALFDRAAPERRRF